VAGRIFVDSLHNRPLKIARMEGGKVVFDERAIAELIATIKHNSIDVVIFDPFVSCHSIPENDNVSIDKVIKRLAEIALECNCAIEIVHHVRKAFRGAELTSDDARGGSAIVNACRSVRILNRMNQIEADAAGIASQKDRRQYFRCDRDKANMAPAEDASWWYIGNVEIENGDHVGVVETWEFPKTADLTVADIKAIRLDVQNSDIVGTAYMLGSRASDGRWIGCAFAKRLGLDAAKDAKRISPLIIRCLNSGALHVVERKGANRKLRKFVVKGHNWENDQAGENKPPIAEYISESDEVPPF